MRFKRRRVRRTWRRRGYPWSRDGSGESPGGLGNLPAHRFGPLDGGLADIRDEIRACIGSNARLFRVAISILVRPLPIPGSGRIDRIAGRSGPGRQDIGTAPDFSEAEL